MRNYFVRDIMSTNPITVTQYDTLATVNEIFVSQNIHHIPATEGDDLIGIISSADFERSKQGKSMFVNHNVDEHNDTILQVTLVGMVMTKQVTTISEDSTLIEAYQIFKMNKFRSLPVKKGNTVVGIVTPMDFLDFYFNKLGSNG